MSEPIPITTRISDSYPLIIGKLNDYQQQIDEATQSYQQQIDEIELLPGPEGLSAYQVWLDAGNQGSVTDFLAALKGEPGDRGEGVPTGGSTGQVLSKSGAADYATQWSDPASGAGLTQAQADKLAAIGTTCILTLSADQPLPNTTWTPIVWDVETRDPGNWHGSTNQERIVLPAGAYSVAVYSVWSGSATSYRRQRLFRHTSGGSVLEGLSYTDPTKDNFAPAMTPYQLVAAEGDYLVLDGRQDSGSTLGLLAQSRITITRVG